MFERKDISKLKKDTILDVELLGSKFNLHTLDGVSLVLGQLMTVLFY